MGWYFVGKLVVLIVIIWYELAVDLRPLANKGF